MDKEVSAKLTSICLLSFRNQGTDWHVTKISRNRFLYFLEDNSALVWSVELQAVDLKEILFRWLHCLGTALITEHSTGFSQWNTMKLDFYTVGVLPKKLRLRQSYIYLKRYKNSNRTYNFCFWAGWALMAITESFCIFLWSILLSRVFPIIFLWTKSQKCFCKL